MVRKTDRANIIREIYLESASGKREVRISDLSAGGCFIDSILTANPGESVKLILPTSSGEQISIAGEVAYSIQGGFGVKFTSLTKDEVAMIEKMVSSSP